MRAENSALVLSSNGEEPNIKAAVFHELGKPMQIETVSKPQAGRGRPDWRLVLDLLEPRRVDPGPMITDIVKLDELIAVGQDCYLPR